MASQNTASRVARWMRSVTAGPPNSKAGKARRLVPTRISLALPWATGGGSAPGTWGTARASGLGGTWVESAAAAPAALPCRCRCCCCRRCCRLRAPRRPWLPLPGWHPPCRCRPATACWGWRPPSGCTAQQLCLHAHTLSRLLEAQRSSRFAPAHTHACTRVHARHQNHPRFQRSL
jgi:hypothetical protein